MKSRIPERSVLTYFVFSFLSLGIYSLYFWTKVSNDVNVLCEGDGKKTKKYFPFFLLNFVTLGIVGLVWKYKITERLKDNAERYKVNINDTGLLVIIYSTIGFILMPIFAPLVAKALIIKDFNKIAKAYNDYNGLVDPDADKKVDLFGSAEIA